MQIFFLILLLATGTMAGCIWHCGGDGLLHARNTDTPVYLCKANIERMLLGAAEDDFAITTDATNMASIAAVLIYKDDKNPLTLRLFGCSQGIIALAKEKLSREFPICTITSPTPQELSLTNHNKLSEINEASTFLLTLLDVAVEETALQININCQY